MHNIVIHSALACFASISLIVLLRNTALRMGLVDYPGGRKQHEGGVPVVGGIAIYGAFAFSALLKQYGVVSLSFALTAFAIGAALLLLSAFWHPTRAFVLGFLPLPLQQRLAPFR